jgi:hypothetical protein
MFQISASNAPSATQTSKNCLFSRPSATMTLMAESIARSAIGHDAKVLADQEADSVAVAETDTNSVKKESHLLGFFLFVITALRYILLI